MVAQEGTSETVHAHVEAVLTEIALVRPAADADTLVGVSVKVHPGADCARVNVSPPIVTMPVRGEVVVFAPIVIVTEPLPLPLAPLVMVSQAALLAAVQAQLLPAVTVTVCDSPAAPAVLDAGLMA